MQIFKANGNFTYAASVGVAMLCACIYFSLFRFNFLLFEEFQFSKGVNWIYLPSGLRLLFVLLFFEVGAVGVGLGSLAINYLLGDSTNHVFNIVTAFISGFSPYLARCIAVDWFHINADLQGMTARIFFKITLLFAFVSPVLHQLWFYWSGVTENFVHSTFAMFVGDWLGTTLVLAFAGFILKYFMKVANWRRVRQ